MSSLSGLCRAVALLLERVETLLRQPEELRLRHLQVVRLDDGVVDGLGEQLEADFFLDTGNCWRGGSSPCRRRFR